MRARRFIALIATAIVLLSQLHVWSAKGCSMCGASCKCAARASAGNCCVRAAGCGGAASDEAIGPQGPLRAVLAAAAVIAPPLALDTVPESLADRTRSPARDPLDQPPRLSC